MIAPEMPAAVVVALLELFEKSGIKVWLDGGWGVDALLGTQTRVHKDLDVIIGTAHVTRIVELLSTRGYLVQHGGSDSNFVLAHPLGLEVDVHAVTFDNQSNGRYRLANGEEWMYPAAGFTGRGVIAGAPVRCLSPETQVLSHAYGYVPTDKDICDMERLRDRFGVELPAQLQRSTSLDR